MMQTTSRNRNILIGCLIVAMLLIMPQASAWGQGSRPTQVVLVQGQPDDAALHLEATFAGNVLIGTVTVSDKDGRPWTDMRGQAYLLDSTGQRLAVILLHPLSPGEFRLIAPLGRLNGPGYLDVRLPGRGKAGERRDVYEVNPAGRTVTWVKTAPGGAGDFSVQTTGGPDAFGYTWDDTASYAWVDTSGGTSIPSLRDDDWVGPYNVGFTFSFYGQNYTQFYLDSNGYIGFDNTQTQPYSANSRLPSPHRPNSLIAPFWDDLDPSQGGTVRYRTFGSPGSRYLVVEWSGVPRWGTSDAQSFELILYEGSNNIKLQYPSTRQGTGGDLRSATAGIENSDGTIGSEYPYIIPINMTAAVQFNYNRPDNNVFLTPDRQGSSAAAGSSVAFHVLVKNLGANADAYTMSRSTFTGSDWAVSFYQSNGVTPLSGNSTGSIAAGAQTDIVVKVSVPGGASIGDWTRATVRAQGSGGAQSTATVDVMLTPSFYQMYSDDYSGDGTEDAEIYVGPVEDGASHTQRLTTDQDGSTYPATASTPDGNAVVAWNTNYWNGAAWVSEIEYTVVDRSGSFVRTITRLTNNSAATQRTLDWSPTIAVAPNGNILIAWSYQVDTNGDGSVDRLNAKYTIVNSSGGVVKPVTALTNNTSDYPSDYPPSAVALTGGNFLLTWEHAASSSGPVDIYYTVLASNGSVVKSAAPLTSGGFNGTPRAASLPNGKAAIVWTLYNSYGNGEIYYAVLNADGSSPSSLTPITTNGNSASSGYADAAALSEGQLAVAWTQATLAGTQIQYTIVGSTTPTPTYTPTPTRTPTPTPTGGPGCVTIVSEDFEGSFPGTTWQVFDNDGTTNGEYYWAKKNCKAYAGSYSGWAVGGGANGAALACGSNYPNNANSWMVYGPFSLVGATAADLKFKLWLNSELNYDGVCQMASINGANFSGGCTTGNTQGWIDSVLDLTSAGSLGNLTGQPNVWIALMFPSNSSNNNPEGAYVDNIVLRKCSTSGGTSTPTPTPTRTSTPSTQTPTPTPTRTPTTTPPTPTNTPTPTPTGGPGWVTIVSENFEGSFPGAWQVGDNDGTTNGEYYWAKKNCKFYAGGYSGWAVGGGANGAALSCGSNYPNNADSWMVYGPFSLVGATAADLKFKLWLNSESGYDFVCRYASIDGNNFSGTCTSGNTSGWIDRVLDLANVPTLGNLMGQSSVWIALRFVSDSSNTYPEGAYVDDIVLRKCTSGSCPAASNTTPISGSDQIIEFTTQQVRAPDAQHTPGAQRTPSAQRASTNVRIQSPAAPQAIYTIPNDINDWNINVSLAVDSQDRLIMTWLDSGWYNPFSGRWLVTRPTASYLFYALADKNGNTLTPATILQRTRRSYLWSSWNGYGNDHMPPQAAQGPVKVYLPVVLRNYPPLPPPQPVKNGGFEETPDLIYWTSAGSGQLAPAVVSSLAHGGSSHAAVLGYQNAPCLSEPHGDSSLSQSIKVPDSGSPRLSLYYRIMTYDRLVGDKYDWFAVYINGALVLQTGRISPTTITACASSAYDTGWQQFTYDLSTYQGQTIEIRLVNHTSDYEFNTWTYVDDVSVN